MAKKPANSALKMDSTKANISVAKSVVRQLVSKANEAQLRADRLHRRAQKLHQDLAELERKLGYRNDGPGSRHPKS
ncbi:MAG TPA: hypothetical protein VE998_09990 [Terriglobales bacterium]|nr:hypothetical protein [Terriglobales bacterium]